MSKSLIKKNYCSLCRSYFYGPQQSFCKKCSPDHYHSEESVLEEIADYLIKRNKNADYDPKLQKSDKEYRSWKKAFLVTNHSKYLTQLDKMEEKGVPLPPNVRDFDMCSCSIDDMMEYFNAERFQQEYDLEPVILKKTINRQEYVSYRMLGPSIEQKSLGMDLEYMHPKWMKRNFNLSNGYSSARDSSVKGNSANGSSFYIEGDKITNSLGLTIAYYDREKGKIENKNGQAIAYIEGNKIEDRYGRMIALIDGQKIINFEGSNFWIE